MTEPALSSKIESGRFKLRVLPWFTDGCTTFLANLFKWLPMTSGGKLRVLEFGGGNSTLFFLTKGLKVTTVESDAQYVELIRNLAEENGFRVMACNETKSFTTEQADNHDLTIIRAGTFEEIARMIDTLDYDILINDGMCRREITEKIFRDSPHRIVVIDNVEYAANWGRLDRSSAKPDLIKAYRSILRSPRWFHYIFEQPEGRSGRGTADKTGWESPHRWASAVLWPCDHLLAKLMTTHIGFPMVNLLGEDDGDIETLGERCAFDWQQMKWLKPPFPPELDLKLDRDFD